MIPKVIFSTPIYSSTEYPRVRYCLQLIESVRQQMPQDSYLHIIVNDGSTDETTTVLAAAAAEDPRLIIVNQERQGGTVAFNVGIEVSLHPERYRDLLGDDDCKKLSQFDAELVNFTGVDDLIGPGLPEILQPISHYPEQTVIFWGISYRSFPGDYPFSHEESAPFHSDPARLLNDLFRVENFPSHLLYFRRSFLRELRRVRGFSCGVLDPQLLSPITYELMMFCAGYAIEQGLTFGLLPGNLGAKRYGIGGTMTEHNKAAGRYENERQMVFERYHKLLPAVLASFPGKRPSLDLRYFRRLQSCDPVFYDPYLERVMTAGDAWYRHLAKGEAKQ